MTNAKGEVSTLEWTTDNKVSKVTYPTGKTSLYTYNTNGYLASQTNELGEKSVLCYDERQVDTADTLRHWSVLSRRIMPLGVAAASTCTTTLPQFTWTYAADTRGNIVKITDPEGSRTATVDDFTTKYTYGAVGTANAGLVLTKTMPMGGVFNYGPYHASGQPEKIVDPVGGTTTFGYDPTRGRSGCRTPCTRVTPARTCARSGPTTTSTSSAASCGRARPSPPRPTGAPWSGA